MESIQTFSLTDGRTWEERHESRITAESLITTSFEMDCDGVWKEK
ncbi:hypothetical protein ATE92_1899 [Ulvibacter sp. MAR_2010_11]|nr:hypothetical protein [Ulvibacter sp. MAR_2010_11]PKA83733.1 hypothetical protein ATE92_1899 [Ulvibacter sp. MAR_2010_11]